MARKYRMKRRAERQEETRRRIIEATVELHQGGGEATISAIAELAGVQRPTVYRHFPDERSLLTACTGHYLALNPPPDPVTWRDIADKEERLRVALSAVYAYYRWTEKMFVSAAVAMERSATLREVLAPYFAYWEAVREMLRAGWPREGEAGRRVRAAIGHALGFETWRSLAGAQGLDDAEAVALMVGLVTAAATARTSGQPAM